MKYQIIEFIVNGSYYGLDIQHVNGIHKANTISITPLPSLSKAVLGITTMRDQVYPVVDLQKKLGFESTAIGSDTKLIIMDVEGQQIGVLVEEVTDIHKPDEEDIRDAQNLTFGKDSVISCLVKADDHFVIVLDAGKLFENDEILSMNVEQILEKSL